MSPSQKLFLFLTRISLGWLFFYSGITKVLNPEWSAAGYLQNAKAFTGLFSWFAPPGILALIKFVNGLGPLLLGISLILGIGVRLSSVLGAVLMMFYYLPLGFPYPNAHSFIVDEHIIYALVLLLFAAIRAGRIWGLENWCANLPICSKFPKLRNWLG